MSRTYATLADLLDRYEEKDIERISYRNDQDKGKINEKAVNIALVQASGEIDEYVGARYVLPLTAVSDQIVQIACIIARYYMEKGKRVESAEEDYKRSIIRLEELRDGIATLGLDENEALPELNGGGAMIESDALVWSRKNSKGFI